MTEKNDTIPTIGIHRGVGLHDQQSEDRLAVVRAAIDAVYEIADAGELVKLAADPCWPPEARLFAAAKVEAIHGISVDRRETRSKDIDLDYLRAATAGLNSKQWRDRDRYCSMFDYSSWGAPGSKKPAKREKPLVRVD